MQEDADGLQEWPEKLLTAGLTPEALQIDRHRADQLDLGKTLLASMAVHQDLRRDVVEGLCLFRVAAYRLHSGGSVDTLRAERVAFLVKEKVYHTAALVS